MHTVKLDLKHGSVSIDSSPLAIDEKGVLAGSIAKLCSPPAQTDRGREQYRLSRRASVCGKSAEVLIEVGEGKICAVTILFDLIEFFESSILESRILKACEKSSHVNFNSNHPSTAFLENCEWGQAVFFYDPKQGDLTLDITFN